jgi:hypothetical protein
VEIGYSKQCIDRLKHHNRHRNSTYIMNLTESICAVLADMFGTLYQIEQAAIYLIWAPEQAEISEIGFTKLAEGYTHNAGGFSHFPAGLSNHSANSVPAREWNNAKNYLIHHSVFPANLKAHTDRLEAKVLAVEEEVRVKNEKELAKLAEASREAAKHICELSTPQDADTDDVRETRALLLSAWTDLQNDVNNEAKYLEEEFTEMRELQGKMRGLIEISNAMEALFECIDEIEDTEDGGEGEEEQGDMLDSLEAVTATPRRATRAPVPMQEITVMTSDGPKKLRA